MYALLHSNDESNFVPVLKNNDMEILNLVTQIKQAGPTTHTS